MEKHKIHKQFPGQKAGEQISVLVRKHWISDVKIVAVFTVLGLLPLTAYIALLVAFWPEKIEYYHVMLLLVFVTYMLFAFLVTYIKWLNEELDVIIVTNERIIGHDQVDFFHKQISETDLAQVQDVKGIEKGVLGSIFHFGSLEIQTAGNKIVFNIHNVGHPYELARKILDVRDTHIDKEKFEKSSDPSPQSYFS